MALWLLRIERIGAKVSKNIFLKDKTQILNKYFLLQKVVFICTRHAPWYVLQSKYGSFSLYIQPINNKKQNITPRKSADPCQPNQTKTTQIVSISLVYVSAPNVNVSV